MRLLLLCTALALAGCKHAEPAPADPPHDAAPPAGDGSGPAHTPALPHGHLMLPPSPGQSRFVGEGCVALAEPPTEETRALPAADQVEASALGNGIVVSHELAHACCLKAESTAKVDGAQVVITETLSGTACRCRCSSTLKTAVGLTPGNYDVVVKTVEPGQTRTAWSGELTVK